ncbi:hypothetical protein SAMN05421790_10698 [Kroppenstedtia eburnea]|uniref:Uncharacterized protein n=1 Tax=Kroppenstedtia eburnea TaxID=714067 RepID=A0A1N7MHI0_9BACL|nr:hypothetical protein SAMN05421790_10698 [Kroppenstedtia eburnea]
MNDEDRGERVRQSFLALMPEGILMFNKLREENPTTI